MSRIRILLALLVGLLAGLWVGALPHVLAQQELTSTSVFASSITDHVIHFYIDDSLKPTDTVVSFHWKDRQYKVTVKSLADLFEKMAREK